MAASAPPAVAEAIEAARAEASRTATRTASEIVDVDQEISKLGKAIENLVQQRETLIDYRARLAAQSGELERTGREDAHEALYATLLAQAEAIHARGEAWADAHPDRLALRSPTGSAVSSLVDELRTSRAALDAAPDPPADALAHHSQLEARLRALLNEQTEPATFDGPELAVDVVCCVDAPEGTPELLVVLLPVRSWVDDPVVARDELPLWLAARVAQALFAAARAVGFGDADVRTGPALDHDLLDIEVDLTAAPDGFVEELLSTLREHLAAAPELTAGRVAVRVVELDASIVFPSDPEEHADG